ncbi:MAG: mechanosensitive ion channel family protein [Planctomycetota bacterium]
MDLGEPAKSIVTWLLTSGMRIVLIIVLALLALLIGRWISNRMFRAMAEKDDERKKRADTLSSVLTTLIGIVALSVALIMILGEFGVRIGPIIAALGIAGVAVGFGAQHLVRDLINGFFILMDDQIRVGDVVSVADKAGLVERIGLRLTVLRDLSGNVHYVPNGDITVVTNMTKGYSCYLFDIGVAYRENVDEVIEVLREVDAGLRADDEYTDDILEPIEIFGLDNFGDSAITIKARTKTRPLRQWAVGREFNRRLKKRFDELDIEIPFPHLTLYAGQDKDGTAAPLHIAQAETGG